jgi:hypothetical protein
MKEDAMAENKPCVRCERMIDANARNCVYCSWNQAQPRPPETPVVPLATPYVPPPDNRIRNRLFGVVGFAVLVIVAFVVALLVHRADANETSATQTTTSTSSPASGSTPRTTVVLVPVDGDVASQEPPPVTSAPPQPLSAGSVPLNGERTDATALPSEAYSAAASRAKAENAARPNEKIVDPRTIGGGIESGPTRRASTPSSRDEVARIAVHRTQPVPLYQPVPSMQVNRQANARLILTVGSEGRVQSINVAQSIPGEMPRLIAAVQDWRFRPAMENGQPVTSTFAVDITVRPR